LDSERTICWDLPTCKYRAQQKQQTKASEQYIFLSYPPAPLCIIALSSTLPALWEVETSEGTEKTQCFEGILRSNCYSSRRNNRCLHVYGIWTAASV